MSSRKRVWIFFLLTTAWTVALQPSYSQTQIPSLCEQATTSKPGVGVAYRGELSIDDYKLRARIPDGLTGWGGVATDAPFHGFTIFLDREMRSCIVFEVHLRIDDDEIRVPPHAAKTMSLGNAVAWQITRSKSGKGTINIATYFSSRQNDQVDDGTILLVSPPEKLRTTKSVYDTFLKSISLGGTPPR